MNKKLHQNNNWSLPFNGELCNNKLGLSCHIWTVFFPASANQQISSLEKIDSASIMGENL